jgi:hypothetical protein
MSTTVRYSPGDIVKVKDYTENVTLTSIVSTSSSIGYSGTYQARWNGKTIDMTLSWIPQGLIERIVYSPSWR